jgi:hypothetical protein
MVEGLADGVVEGVADGVDGVEGVVDTARYPLDAPGSPAWRALVGRVRRDLGRLGCSVLPDFVRPSVHEALRREGDAVAPWAHDAVEVVNAYNIAPDTRLPDDHPGRVPLERGNGFVARDLIPPHFVVRRLHTSPQVRRFVAACLGLAEVYPLADPLAGLCLNVIPPGRAHPWHFDTNEFSVSILTRAADDGGVFEFCPNIRSAADENLAGVRAVLAGHAGGQVRRLALRPGDLQLFAGRYSLHRVTTVRGPTARHSAILAYCARPGVVGSVTRTQQLFGRVLPDHVAADRHRVRTDRLLD